MRIAYIGQKGIPAKSGGVEKHIEEIATRMAKRNHQVFVYARKNYTEANLKKYKGVQIINLPSLSTKNLDAISHTFIATLHALFQNYDVIHYQAIGPSSLLFIVKLFKRKTAIVATHHCQDYFHKKWGFLARAYLRLGEYIAVNFSDQIIAVSKNLNNYIEVKYHKKAEVITNGVDVVPAEKSDYLEKWNLQKGDYVVYIGRLIRHKGVHYLIKAFKNLESKHLTRGKKLVIVGGGFYTENYVKELKDLARGEENIIFTGDLKGEELRQIFSHSYLFVQPSESEGLSIALLEAMGYGKAILSSDIKENKEPLNDKTALFFQSGNHIDLEEKLVYLINHPALAKQMGERAREKARKEYSWDTIVDETESVYEKVLSQKRKAKP
ncbi:MAG TPA: glycosyltransferase [Candidatus Portnoybacteria bacterium]|nr:glycosyltransferase [Candidatus Portnoybacteria bacterium]